MKKLIFKNKSQEIHIGFNAPENFNLACKKDLDKILFNLVPGQLLWRCTVCNDLHISKNPPKVCPTCFEKDAYIQVSLSEFKKILEVI